jgi:hypothetical protein
MTVALTVTLDEVFYVILHYIKKLIYLLLHKGWGTLFLEHMGGFFYFR